MQHAGMRARKRSYALVTGLEPKQFQLLTVGFGIAPNLLVPTDAHWRVDRRPRATACADYRRWGITPRPENYGGLQTR